MTNDRRFLKPAREGLIVRDPRTLRPLAAAGEWKRYDTYWRRRVRFGDAVEAKPPVVRRERKPEAAKVETETKPQE